MGESNCVQRRALLRRLFEAGLKAVAPGRALLRHVQLDGQTLIAGGRRWDLAPGRRVLAVGGGKGVAPMARALEALLGSRLDAGTVVTRYGHGMPLERIDLLEAAHPVVGAPPFFVFSPGVFVGVWVQSRAWKSTRYRWTPGPGRGTCCTVRAATGCAAASSPWRRGGSRAAPPCLSALSASVCAPCCRAVGCL